MHSHSQVFQENPQQCANEIFTYGYSIQNETSKALPTDFKDLVGTPPPMTVVEQAAYFYRCALEIMPGHSLALGYLGNLIETKQILALPSDFPDSKMPDTPAAQAAMLYRRAIGVQSNNFLALDRLAGLIQLEKVTAQTEDFPENLEILEKGPA
ncbi:MAG TPA: hypothetical protein VGF75_02350, partial [Candidatus Saccharimonadales bacterium]